MSARIKLSSAAVWFSLALMIFATSFVGNLDGLLFPPVDRTKTVITALESTEGRTIMRGTFFRTRPCIYKGIEFFTGDGLLISAQRIGPIVNARIGVNKFGPWLLAETPKNVLCDTKMVTKYACYWDSAHFPLITTAVLYDGSESTAQICERNLQ